jgi:site-specific recombinase XerD
MLFNTGARISELVSLTADDVRVVPGGRCHVHFLGKGRKDRTVPLWEDTSRMLMAYMEAHDINGPNHVLAGRNVAHLTRSGARSQIDAVAKRAARRHPELAGRRITPHTFRHATAMAMLYAGVDIATVAIWLGHESINTTHKYVVTNMKAKEDALEMVRVGWGDVGHARYKAPQSVLDFLSSL